MTASKDTPAGEHADREIATTRVLHAPRALVFQAFTDPAHLARWWGPAGFTSTFDVFDARPGGAWRFVMHGPDGTDFKNESVFVELVKPERIVFRHLKPMHVFELTITLAADGKKTRLGWRMRFETAAECEQVKAFAVAANEQNLDRLEAELSRMG
jgi:uncharacterized protein YndB with AHSA1/START domain